MSRKIALVIRSLESGGAERVMTHIANHFATTDCVTVITLSGAIDDHYELAGQVARVRLEMPVSENLWSVIMNNSRLWREIRSVFDQTRPDVVVSFIDRTNNQVLLATRGKGTPVVVSERIDPRFHRIHLRPRILRRLLYPHAARVVVQTQAVRAWAESLVDPSRVVVIPNPVRSGHVSREREPTVLAVGRLDPQKGFDTLIRAFSGVADRHPAWRIVIVGDGPERKALKMLASGLGIDDRLQMTGVVQDPVGHMARAGVFVLSSRYEGFPNVLLEAMSTGASVIATDCPSGPGEILTSGVDGILIEPDNVQAMSEELDRLLADGSLRGLLGVNAKNSVRRFDHDVIMALWDDLFDAVIAESRSEAPAHPGDGVT